MCIIGNNNSRGNKKLSFNQYPTGQQVTYVSLSLSLPKIFKENKTILPKYEKFWTKTGCSNSVHIQLYVYRTNRNIRNNLDQNLSLQIRILNTERSNDKLILFKGSFRFSALFIKLYCLFCNHNLKPGL